MPTVQEVTDPLAAFLVPVPPVAPGLCDICHRGVVSPPWTRCYSCGQTAGQVTRHCTRVMPISFTPKSGQLYSMLKSYKYDNPIRTSVVRLGALLTRHLRDHGECIGEWDVITHVPSSGRHPPPHPLTEVVEVVQWLNDQHETLLKLGDDPVGHNTASDTAFVTTQDVDEARVLVVDDTWTSGATAQSAASALSLAGADVVGIVPIGRIVSPSPNRPDDVDWWDAQQKKNYNFADCCVH